MTIQKYDWDRVRQEYVEGHANGEGILEQPTLEVLAQKYEIPWGTIKSRAAKEDWGGERNLFHELLMKTTRELTLQQLGEKASQLDVQAFMVARAALGLAGKAFIEGVQAGTLSPGDQERLLRLCDLAHRMGRRALGIGEASE